MLSICFVIKRILFELAMWICLKKDNWNDAWDYLVDSRSCGMMAINSSKVAEDLSVKNYLGRLYEVENAVFPPQVYLSPGFLVESFKCSICSDDYEKCNHISGKAYNGEYCQKVVEEALELREVSVVESPYDKKARAYEHETDDGMIRDRMTWVKREKTRDELDDENIDKGRKMSGVVASYGGISEIPNIEELL